MKIMQIVTTVILLILIVGSVWIASLFGQPLIGLAFAFAFAFLLPCVWLP